MAAIFHLAASARKFFKGQHTLSVQTLPETLPICSFIAALHKYNAVLQHKRIRSVDLSGLYVHSYASAFKAQAIRVNVYIYVYIFIYSFFRLFIYLLIYLLINLFMYLFIFFKFIYLFIYLFIYYLFFISLAVYLFIYSFIYLFFFIYLFICLFIYLFIYLFIFIYLFSFIYFHFYGQCPHQKPTLDSHPEDFLSSRSPAANKMGGALDTPPSCRPLGLFRKLIHHTATYISRNRSDGGC